MVLAVVYIVLMVLWAFCYLPGTAIGPNGPRVGIGVQFILFCIIGWILFGGQLVR
jgi:hypothetical protein